MAVAKLEKLLEFDLGGRRNRGRRAALKESPAGHHSPRVSCGVEATKEPT